MKVTKCGLVGAKSNGKDGVVLGVKIVAGGGDEGVLGVEGDRGSFCYEF